MTKKNALLSIWQKSAGVLLVFLLCLFPSQSAYAYLDPGSGSLFLQMLIAFLVAIPLSLKIVWRKFGSWFKKSKKNERDECKD